MTAALLLAALALIAAADGGAATGSGRVRADTLWSQALGTRKQFVVYLPPSYDRSPSRRYPVAYYLHGLWGSEWDWVRRGRLDAAMDSLVAAGAPEMIVVMPDGDDSWYTTWNSLGDYAACARDSARAEPAASYCVPWPHYDDYIARDLVAYVDSSYRTLAGRAHRGVAGLSMGGLGAVNFALNYPDVFSAAASHSGVLAPTYGGPDEPPAAGAGADALESMADLRASWRRFWPLMEPAFGKDLAGWRARDPTVRLTTRSPGGAHQRQANPRFYIDAGREDPFSIQSRVLAALLTVIAARAATDPVWRPQRIEYVYRLHPGAHDWAYWRAHVGESLAWLARLLASR